MSNSVKLYPNLGTAQGSFSFPFSYLDANDIKAYVDGVLVFENNASTNTAVNGVTYTVAFQSVGATTLTFSPDAIAGSDIRIQRNTDLTTKAVDFADGAVLTEASLDEAVDQVFFAAQEAIDKANDSITVDTDDKWDAQSKVIKNVANPVNAQDAATKDYLENTWLTLSDKAQLNSLDLDNLDDVADDIANVNTVAGSIANVNTVAGIDSDVTTVAGIDTEVTTVAGIDTEVTTVAGDSADIQTVAGKATEIGRLGTADAVSDMNTLATAAIVADLDTLADISTDITDVADIDSDVTTVAGISANVTTVAGNNANVSTVAGVSSDVTTVAGISSDVTTVANDGTDIGTVAGISSNVSTVAGVASNVTTVAGISSDVTAVANISQDIQDVQDEIANLQTVANDLNEATSEIETVAASIANVDAVGADIANVNTVATNISDVNNFADTYFISATAPSSPTLGDLWFDTTTDVMKVYASGGFVNAGSSVNGTSERVSYTATAGQTSFAATYDAGFVDVYLNGIKLIDGTDFTATSGSAIVLTTGAALNDTVDIVAYGTFQISTTGLNDLTDVDLTGLANDQFLQYNSSTSNFEPATIATDVSGDSTPQLGGDLDTNGNDVNFGDNDKAVFGADGELEIFSNGTTAVISETGGGDLYIKGATTRLLNPAADKAYFVGNDAGASTVFYNGQAKLATTSTGVDVTGKLQGGGTALQYDSGLVARASTHATSRRASVDFGGWTVGQDASANGTKDFFFYDGVASAHRMNIDTSGRVTKPSNPAFRASYVGTNGDTYTVGEDAVVPFNTIHSNIGSHYSTSTNRFTAPVGGHYHFNFIGFGYDGAVVAAAVAASVKIRVNGNNIAYLNYDYSASSARYISLSGGHTMYLNSNDYVDIHSTPGIYVDASGTYTQFSGFLIG